MFRMYDSLEKKESLSTDYADLEYQEAGFLSEQGSEWW